MSTQNSLNNRVSTDFTIDGDLQINGGLTATKQPIFVVHVNPSLSNVTGGGVTYEPIKYNSPGTITAGTFNFDTGKYMIPEDGVYQFHASLALQNLIVGTTKDIDFHFELSYLDTGHSFKLSPPSYLNPDPGQQWVSYNFNWTTTVRKGWEIWTGVTVRGGEQNSVNILALYGGNGVTNFSGFKLY